MGSQNSSDYRLQRVNGRFHAVWYDARGRRQRRSLGTDDQALAQARLGEFVRQLSFQSQAGAALTVASIYDAYAEDREAEIKPAAARIRDAWKRQESMKNQANSTEEGTGPVFTSQGSAVRVRHRPPRKSNSYPKKTQWFSGRCRPSSSPPYPMEGRRI